MSTVFIVNQPREVPQSANRATYNVSPAMEYGNIRFIFTQDKFPSPSADLVNAIEHAWECLKDYDCENDFIVWAGGDPISMLIVAPILYEVSTGVVKYLKYERGRDDDGRPTGKGYYVPLVVGVFNEPASEEDDV